MTKASGYWPVVLARSALTYRLADGNEPVRLLQPSQIPGGAPAIPSAWLHPHGPLASEISGRLGRVRYRELQKPGSEFVNSITIAVSSSAALLTTRS